MTELESTTDATFGDVPAGIHAMAVMGTVGDTKTFWDATKPAEVEAARAQFNMLTKEKRYAAFRVHGVDGSKGEQMREFDAQAERIIFAPPMQGG